MRTRTILLVLVSTMMIAEVYPQVCAAKGKKGAIKKKKKVQKPNTDDDLSNNPYAATEEAATAGEASEADATEGEGESGADEPASLLPQGGGDQGTVRRSGRMEFDERLVKGQTAKSGAVYLFKRVPRRLPGLVPMRRSYRRRIVAPVLGEREIKPAVYSQEPPEEPTADAATETQTAESASSQAKSKNDKTENEE